MSYGTRTVAAIFLIILCTIGIDVSWQFYAERSVRIQAQYNLIQAQVCVNDVLLGDSDKPLYRDASNDEIERALKTCAREMKVSPSGDMFAFDLRTKEFVFDPSLDCFVEGGKYMTPGSECELHKDKATCKTVLKVLTSGYSSDSNTKVWWKFNDGREFLEWIVLPNEGIGFDGVARGGVIRPKQVVLVQGVQENELLARYSHFRLVLYIIAGLSIIFNLLVAVHENLMEKRDAEYKRVD